MKCIKERCEFYSNHDFYSGYFICGLLVRGRSFPKNKDVGCIIDEELDSIFKYIGVLNEIKTVGDNCD